MSVDKSSQVVELPTLRQEPVWWCNQSRPFYISPKVSSSHLLGSRVKPEPVTAFFTHEKSEDRAPEILDVHFGR